MAALQNLTKILSFDNFMNFALEKKIVCVNGLTPELPSQMIKEATKRGTAIFFPLAKLTQGQGQQVSNKM